MEIAARIVDGQFAALSDDFFFADDSGFAAVEQEAKRLVADQECMRSCIKWNRYSDGQSAYWGPHGAQFEPHWYCR
jgi:hypothetical protein